MKRATTKKQALRTLTTPELTTVTGGGRIRGLDPQLPGPAPQPDWGGRGE